MTLMIILGLLLGFVALGIYFYKIYSNEIAKQTVSSKSLAKDEDKGHGGTSPATATPPKEKEKESHGHGHAEKEVNGFLTVLSLGVAAGIVVAIGYFLVLLVASFFDESKTDKQSCDTQALVLVSQRYVGPNTPWVTPKVTYALKLRSDGHAFSVQFTSSKGGWTEKTALPKEGNIDIIPLDAVAGPIRVTAGEGEDKEFLVQLYKRVTLR